MTRHLTQGAWRTRHIKITRKERHQAWWLRDVKLHSHDIKLTMQENFQVTKFSPDIKVPVSSKQNTSLYTHLINWLGVQTWKKQTGEYQVEVESYSQNLLYLLHHTGFPDNQERLYLSSILRNPSAVILHFLNNKLRKEPLECNTRIRQFFNNFLL